MDPVRTGDEVGVRPVGLQAPRAVAAASPGSLTPPPAPPHAAKVTLGRRIKVAWAQVSLKRAIWGRKLNLIVAYWLLKPLDCTVVGKPSLFQSMEHLAALASFIEKSGGVRHRTAAYQKLSDKTRSAVIALQDAARVGDPALNANDLRQTFLRFQWMGLSRRKKRMFEKQATGQAMVRELMKSGALIQTPKGA